VTEIENGIGIGIHSGLGIESVVSVSEWAHHPRCDGVEAVAPLLLTLQAVDD